VRLPKRAVRLCATALIAFSAATAAARLVPVLSLALVVVVDAAAPRDAEERFEGGTSAAVADGLRLSAALATAAPASTAACAASRPGRAMSVRGAWPAVSTSVNRTDTPLRDREGSTSPWWQREFVEKRGNGK
jgi:hypothetical protein